MSFSFYGQSVDVDFSSFVGAIDLAGNILFALTTLSSFMLIITRVKGQNMTFSFQPLIDWVGSLFNSFITDVSLRFVAFKTLIYSFITVTLPAVLKNALAWLFSVLVAQVDSIDFGEMSSVVIEFSGLAAWFAVHLRFVDCLSVLVTALVIRFTLNLIPIIG